MCGHWQREPKRTLAYPLLERLLATGKGRGLETVCYSGGDPFAVPELLNDVLAWHEDNPEVDFGIVTAGVADWNRIELRQLAKARWVRVSLDTVKSAKYKEIRGGQLSLTSVLDSIDRMLAAGVNVCIGAVLHKQNAEDVIEVAEYAMTKQIKEVRAWQARPHQRSQKMRVVDFDQDHRHLVEWLRRTAIHLCKLGISNNFHTLADDLLYPAEFRGFPHCYVALYQAFVDASGTIFPCCTTAGDTQKQIPAICVPGMNYGNLQTSMVGLMWANAVKFFEATWKEGFPSVCREGCVPKHIEANQIAYENWGTKCFQ